MAKSDSFFIRKTIDAENTNTFQQGSIDLGAYVDALGKSVLRVHNVQVTYSDNAGRSNTINGGASAVAQWQLTTQSHTDIVRDDDKSVISSGRCHFDNRIGTPELAGTVSDANGINLHDWTNGYLVGVEQIYLGGSASTGFVGDVYITVVMECTVETLTQSAAMALALSQQ
jgi:hypothetical protein